MSVKKDIVWNQRWYKVVFVLRIFTPLLIFEYPWLIIVLSIVLDTIDGGFACQGVMKMSQYQLIDKVLDMWWQVTLLIFIYLRMPDYFIVLFSLFAFRWVGEMVFLRTGKRWLLVAFPNFFEWFSYFLYAITTQPKLAFLLSNTWIYPVLGVMVGLKIANEYALHVKNFSVRRLLGLKVEWVDS